MMKVSKISFVLYLVVVASFFTTNKAAALIVSPLPVIEGVVSAKVSPTTTTDQWSREQQQQRNVSVARIRSTRRSDVDPVADLLSSAVTAAGNDGDADDGIGRNENWKTRIERLRIKASIQNTLDLRVRAILEGKKYLSQLTVADDDTPRQHQGEKISLNNNQLARSDPDHLRYLWSKDSFRSKIERAAELSSEPHPWQTHNFAFPPNDPGWLRHEMITAQDVETELIVGFCEIAMLRCPRPPLSSTEDHHPSSRRGGGVESASLDFTYGDDYDDCADDEDAGGEPCSIAKCAPTIANLVVSPLWRRRGAAKGLVKSAERIVARKWNCEELGLYVEKGNKRALDLYVRAGYQVVKSCSFLADAGGQDSPAKWYMSKPLKV